VGRGGHPDSLMASERNLRGISFIEGFFDKGAGEILAKAGMLGGKNLAEGRGLPRKAELDSFREKGKFGRRRREEAGRKTTTLSLVKRHCVTGSQGHTVIARGGEKKRGKRVKEVRHCFEQIGGGWDVQFQKKQEGGGMTNSNFAIVEGKPEGRVTKALPMRRKEVLSIAVNDPNSRKKRELEKKNLLKGKEESGPLMRNGVYADSAFRVRGIISGGKNSFFTGEELQGGA